ncbi:MAG: LysR family transcriptional regulator, partial [Pseudomonadota bacterium]
MLDHLRQIAIFAKTVEHGSFRKAAEVLQLSPSVVSHHIALLEQQLEVALLYRSTRKLSLTTEGEKLLASAQDLVDSAESFIGMVSKDSPRLIGQLKVTLPAVIANSKLIDHIGEFVRQNPGVKLNLDFTDTPRDIIRDGIDLAIRMGWPEDSALKARKLSTFDRQVVASSDFLASKPKAKTPNDLKDWEWIALTPVGLNHHFQKKDEKKIIIKSKAQLSVNSAYAMMRLVRNGNGLAALPVFLIQEFLDSGELVTVLKDWQIKPVETYAVWPANAPKSGLSKRLVN